MALASGGVGDHQCSMFHLFFARARWALRKLGGVLFGLALGWIPADQPLLLRVDDSLARKHGTCIAFASMYHVTRLKVALPCDDR